MALEPFLSVDVVDQMAGLIAQTLSGGKLVLSVKLLFRPGGSVIKLILGIEDAAVDGVARRAAPIKEAIVKFGQASEFHIPKSVEDALASRIAEFGRDLPRGPLWLRLVRPYGPLGLLPWEARLRTVLGRPVLRLPDTPFRPTERADVLENVVLVDPPDDTPPEVVRKRLQVLVDAILDGSARRATRVHVFARASWQAALAGFSERDARIEVPSPWECPPYSSGDQVAHWTTWVLHVMQQRGIDALHLLGRATRSDSDACFLLSATPHDLAPPLPPVVPESLANRRRRLPDTELSADDVALLLNRAGAWSAVFVPATSDHATPLAFVADDLAHRWHGAVLYLEPEPEEHEVVREAMRLLYTVTATAPPRFEYGFLYCHPDFLHSKQKAAAAALPPALAAQALVLAQRAPALKRVLQTVQRFLPGVQEPVAHVPPGWLAATQRFMEREMLDAARRNSTDILRSHLPAKLIEAGESVKLDEVKERLLDEVRAVVARYQGSGKGDEK
jgi:hypothetical protein